MKHNNLGIILTIVFFLGMTTGLCAQVKVSGTLQKWHKISLQIEGPNSCETCLPNPFLDYRLQVTFTHAEANIKYLVPGYYAADGMAAETSADSGNIWIVHFSPGQTGTWEYEVSFEQGEQLAVDTIEGVSIAPDGLVGSFEITESDKSGRDHRSKGLLEYVGEHYPRFAENGEYFLKIGPDAPENTLAYIGFDDTPNAGGFRKTWAPHAIDYDSASAYQYTWGAQHKGKNLLGALRYLSDIGVNAFSFLTFSLAGDDDNVFPHLLKVPISEYQGQIDHNRWTLGVHHDRFDVSKLEQWERIFSYADQMGLFLHFKTMETENDQRMDDGKLGMERKLYYRELIARFGHHLALNWNISEEISLSNSVIKEIAEYITDIDPYDHPVVFHTYPNDHDRYNAFHGNKSKVVGASMQNGFIQILHQEIRQQVEASADAGQKWLVANDEQGSPSIGIHVDPNDIDLVRRYVVFGTLMAGGYGMEYYYGYQTGCSDLNCQNHRTREIKYRDAVRAVNFFKQNLPFHEMKNMDGLVSNSTHYCFAKEDSVYAVYIPQGGSTSLDLKSVEGKFKVFWFDPRNDRQIETSNIEVVEGGQVVNSGMAPDSTDRDWVVFFKREEIQTSTETKKETNSFRISPNPFSNTIQISVPETSREMSVQIFDLNGKLLYQKRFTNPELNIDSSRWVTGGYLIKISDDKRSQVFKMVKQ